LAAVSALDEAVVPLYPGYPEVRVLVYNVAKKANVGTIVRTAVAFGATQIIVVGNRKINTMGNQVRQASIPGHRQRGKTSI
jgi:tRNA G18 (ribose-2'-O)-methylase SpoU